MARALAPVLLLTIALALPRAVRAAAAEEWEVGLRVAYAAAVADGRRASGALGGADVLYGFTDAWAARLSVASSLHPVKAAGERPGGRVQATSLGLGVTFAVDVLRLVPFLEGGVALVSVGGAVKDARRDFGVEVGAGAEYLLTRRWGLAALLRYQYFPLQLGGADPLFSATPDVFSAGLRLSRLF